MLDSHKEIYNLNFIIMNNYLTFLQANFPHGSAFESGQTNGVVVHKPFVSLPQFNFEYAPHCVWVSEINVDRRSPDDYLVINTCCGADGNRPTSTPIV